MRRIHLLALLVTFAGGASLLPSSAGATDWQTALKSQGKYCCSTYWGYGHYCCGENGCRITDQGCTRW